MKRAIVALVSLLTFAAIGTGVATAGNVACVEEGGVLVITGTADADKVVVRLNPADATEGEVLQEVNGELVLICNFDPATVTLIDASMGDGNDFIDIVEPALPDTPGLDTDAILRGENGADEMSGGGGDDVLQGGPGNDTLSGGGGDDVIDDGPGESVLRGGAGKDEMRGGAGPDVLVGGAGKDVLKGNRGNDRLRARDGAPDTVFGGRGRDDRATVDRADTVRGVEKVRR